MKIKKGNLYKGVYLLLFIPLFTRLLTDNFGLPYIVMPIFDIFSYVLLFFAFKFNRTIEKNNKICRNWLCLYIFVTFVSIAHGAPTLSNLFYEIRPFFRVICAFVIAALVLNVKRFEELYKFVRFLLYINIPVMFVQFVFLGLRQDVLGGLFGNNQGVNSIQNLLCIFLFTVSLVKYLHKQIIIHQLLIDTFVIIFITVLAEINYLLIELIIVSVISILFCRSKKTTFNIRKIILVVIGTATGLVAVSLFLKYNPDRAFLFNVENILEYIGFNEGSTGVYRISRVKVFSQLGDAFFKDNFSLWLCGYGLGNCSTHSSFYLLNSNLQYTYFSTSMVFLQTGLIGIVVTISNYIQMIIICIKNRRLEFRIYKEWNDISLPMTIILLLLFFYNGSSRDIYTAYFVGTFLALPLIVRKEGV